MIYRHMASEEQKTPEPFKLSKSNLRKWSTGKFDIDKSHYLYEKRLAIQAQPSSEQLEYEETYPKYTKVTDGQANNYARHLTDEKGDVRDGAIWNQGMYYQVKPAFGHSDNMFGGLRFDWNRPSIESLINPDRKILHRYPYNMHTWHLVHPDMGGENNPLFKGFGINTHPVAWMDVLGKSSLASSQLSKNEALLTDVLANEVKSDGSVIKIPQEPPYHLGVGSLKRNITYD